MRLGLRELRREPLRFAVLSAAMWLLAVLMLFLGGLLDGLNMGSTGVLRAQDADLIVFSKGARSSLVRSRIDADTRKVVEAIDGVERVHGFGVVLVGAEVTGRVDLADTAVVGYDAATGGIPTPPGHGEAFADRSLKGSGVEIGSQLGLGPARVPIVVVGWVSDANYLGQGGLWVEPSTWRKILNASRPDSALANGTFQALAIGTADGASTSAVAEAIDAATGGTTQTITKDAAIRSLPGIKEQHKTMTQVIGVTAVVAGVVAALFFSLVTLERTRLYGVLKAIGASTTQIYMGLLTQAMAITVTAFLMSAAVTYGVGAMLPPGKLPFRLETSRVIATFVILVVVSAAGCAVSLRRVTRIEPASAIG